jgi:hypothetical protein
MNMKQIYDEILNDITDMAKDAGPAGQVWLWKVRDVVLSKKYKHTHGGLRHRHTAPRLTQAQVLEIRALRAQKCSYKELMRKYPASRGTLFDAIKGVNAYSNTNWSK